MRAVSILTVRLWRSLIGYFIPSEGEAQLAVDWEWLYGKLDSGTYRVTKEVIVKEWSDPSSQSLKCLLATQFIIE